MEQEEKKERKKYWLKLDKDFLKSPQMKVIKNMTNGKDYIIFYLSLMLESVETVGHLRFTSLVPYNAEMLSSITDTNIDIVKSAIKIFCELGMMQIFDDGTIFMTEVPKITGKECESAERVRRYRLKLKEEETKMLQCNADVTKCNDYIDKDKEEDKEIRNNINTDTADNNINNNNNNIYDYVEQNFCRTLSPADYEQIGEWEDNELTRYAIKKAVTNNKCSTGYINGILNGYKRNNITTVQQALNEEEEFKKQKEKNIKYAGMSYKERKKMEEEKMWEKYLKGDE